LVLLSFLSPVVILPTYASLVVVKPLWHDGPSVFLGFLGSCSRTNNSEPISCTHPSLSPDYDLSVLPSITLNVFSLLNGAPLAIAIGMGLSWTFFILFVAFSLRAKFGTRLFNAWLLAQLDKPMVQRASTFLGLAGFVITFFTFSIVYMLCGKYIHDFNAAVEFLAGPPLNAEFSSGFRVLGIGIALDFVILIWAAMKIHIRSYWE